jgi:Rhodopirellula transposase DDE domain
MDTDAQLAQYFAGMWPHLDEHARRLVAASQAVELGYGGISRVSRASGLSRVTLTKGIEELQAAPLAPGRIRHEGGGRHALTSNDPGLAPALDGMVEPTARGDPQSPLRWTCKSARTLAAELTVRHHPVSHTKVTQLLREGGYSLQGNRKTEEGDEHPDRDAQFRHINRAVKRALRAGEPVISVDTKKKELIGNYQNQGRQWRETGTADKVNGHDFPGPEVPRAYPYGIYDLGRNAGFVNVGTDHDTGAFAVASIRGWWRAAGRRLYLRSRRLRLWKWELQRLADQTGLTLTVSHFPPGTSKWNKVEHRLFSFISSNWRGEPLRDYETVVRLIAGTTTTKGLKVTCRLDHRKYPVGRKITDEEFAHVNLKPDKFHGEWNYTIHPGN